MDVAVSIAVGNAETLRIDGTRLWESLMTMARIGATPAGGCNRQALTDEDKAGRELFTKWAEAAGCKVTVDRMGNLFARREGSDSDLPAVIAGSHLDTQPTGGKFDGVYGVLAGLEVVRTLHENQVVTKHPIDIVVWTNEEGARFSPAMIGSGVFAGAFDLDYGHSRTSKNGETIAEELSRIGFAGDRACAPYPIKAAFEAHIEQGPVLERNENTIGIVTGVQGIKWLDVSFNGDPVHAGPTPMSMRRDPMQGIAAMMQAAYAMIATIDDDARLTFGDIDASPGVRNTVPESVTIAVDIRHPDGDTLAEIERRLRDIVDDSADGLNLTVSIREEWYSPAVAFDTDCIAAVEAATESLGVPAQRIVSGAGHDSVYIARVAPTSMIFVPCEGGISHNEAENADADDLAAGCNVLLGAMLSMAVA